MNDSNKSLIPLFLRIYRLLNVITIMTFLAGSAVIYLWLTQDQETAVFPAFETKKTEIELDQESYRSIKDLLSKKAQNTIHSLDNSDVSNRNPFF